MKDSNDPVSLAVEVRGISVALENLNASRKRHDERSIERHDRINEELKKIGEYIAGSNEFRHALTLQIEDMKDSLTDLIALKNQAKGGWWTLCTMSAVIGSALTMFVTHFIK